MNSEAVWDVGFLMPFNERATTYKSISVIWFSYFYTLVPRLPFSNSALLDHNCKSGFEHTVKPSLLLPMLFSSRDSNQTKLREPGTSNRKTGGKLGKNFFPQSSKFFLWFYTFKTLETFRGKEKIIKAH